MTNDERRAEWITRMDDANVPAHLRAGLARYLVGHLHTGSFLHAVLTNNLRGAVFAADDDSLVGLLPIMRFLYNDAPADSWGSPDAVNRWLEAAPAQYAAEVA